LAVTRRGEAGGAGKAVALREAVTAETAVSPREAVTADTNVDGPLTTSTYTDGEVAANKVYPSTPAANGPSARRRNIIVADDNLQKLFELPF
jgi:hypothetical protein